MASGPPELWEAAALAAPATPPLGQRPRGLEATSPRTHVPTGSATGLLGEGRPELGFRSARTGATPLAAAEGGDRQGPPPRMGGQTSKACEGFGHSPSHKERGAPTPATDMDRPGEHSQGAEADTGGRACVCPQGSRLVARLRQETWNDYDSTGLTGGHGMSQPTWTVAGDRRQCTSTALH